MLFRSDRLRNISSHAMRVGPTVRLPLFAGGSIAERIRIREAQLQEATFALEQRVLLAFEEVENAATGLQQGRRRQRELDAALGAAERTRQLAQQRFEAGLDDFLAVLDAEQNRLDIADQHALAATDVVRQFAALHRALGGGSIRKGDEPADD